MPLLLLTIVGVGAYLLFSKSASAATVTQAQQQAAYQQALAANPGGLAPGFQGQATGPYNPYVAPLPAWTQDPFPEQTDEGQVPPFVSGFPSGEGPIDNAWWDPSSGVHGGGAS
jgi:hypothetical protein